MLKYFVALLSVIVGAVAPANSEELLTLVFTGTGNNLVSVDTQTGTQRTIAAIPIIGVVQGAFTYNPVAQTASYIGGGFFGGPQEFISINVNTGQFSTTPIPTGTDGVLASLYTLSSAPTDAVSSTQFLNANQRVAAAFGGGGGLDANGFLTLPTYLIQGVSFNNAGGALRVGTHKRIPFAVSL